MKPKLLFLVLILVTALPWNRSQAQDKKEKEYKNTFKYNITNPIIFGSRSYIFGFERVINSHQTISVNIGHASFPSLGIASSDSLSVSKNTGDKGFHFSAEYRFYLQKENKYSAPRGVYIAPYYSYNYFERSNTWNVNKANFKGNINTDLSLKAHTVGVELGYQFIFWKRVALDLILAGPGIASYHLKAATSSDVQYTGENEDIYQHINDALANKIPGYSLILKDTDFEKKGTTSLTSLNFRYLIQLGFRF